MVIINTGETNTEVMRSNKINLALIADGNYAIPAAVTLRSAINHNRGKIGQLFLLSTNFKQEDFSILDFLCKEDKIAFHLIKVDENLLNSYDGLSPWSKFTFIKIMIPKLLKDEERLLYLDVDMLVTGDLSAVYNADMEGNAISAVPDIPVVREHNRRCGLPADNNYINAGFMLMDLKKWRDADAAGSFDKALEHLKDLHLDFINDQDVINTVFQGSCQALPSKYNVTNHFFGLHSLYCNKEFRGDWKEGRKHPVIIHFTGARRPWKPEVFHPYKREWFRTLAQTPYRRLPYCKLTGNAIKSWLISGLGIVADWFRLL